MLSLYRDGDEMGEKINLSFKEIQEEKDLIEWIEVNSKIIGKSSFIKQVLYKEMLRDKATNK